MYSNPDEIPLLMVNFLNYLDTVKNKSSKTIKEYYYDLRTFFRFLKIYLGLIDNKEKFDDIKINDISIEHLKQLTLNDLHAYLSYAKNKRKNDVCARARKVACLKSFFKYITSKEKLLTTNPAVELESPRLDKKLPRYLNLDESKELLSVVKGNYAERDFAILTLFLNCGLRVSELVGLDVSSIKNNHITVLGKGGKERKAFLNNSCESAISDYLKVRPVNGIVDKDALFLSKRKQRISVDAVQLIVKKYIKEAGLDPKKYSPHKLRHTYATLMYKHGDVDIRALKELLGHKDISTTEIYTHLEEKELQNAALKNPLADITFLKSRKLENTSTKAKSPKML